MPSNVEIKARVKDFPTFLDRASEISQQDGVIIIQRDTFFNCPNGRLKLRCLKDGDPELIFYQRPDLAGPKLSEYSFVKIEDPDKFRAVMSTAYGIKGEVRKKRTLYLVGQTRVHADEVEGLGTFMELEVEMKEGQSTEEGQQIANDLMEKLGVQESDLINEAYMDLILKKCAKNGHQ